MMHLLKHLRIKVKQQAANECGRDRDSEQGVVAYI